MEFVTLRHKFFYYAAAFLSVSLYAPVHNNGCQASPAHPYVKKSPLQTASACKGRILSKRLHGTTFVYHSAAAGIHKLQPRAKLAKPLLFFPKALSCNVDKYVRAYLYPAVPASIRLARQIYPNRFGSPAPKLPSASLSLKPPSTAEQITAVPRGFFSDRQEMRTPLYHCLCFTLIIFILDAVILFVKPNLGFPCGLLPFLYQISCQNSQAKGFGLPHKTEPFHFTTRKKPLLQEATAQSLS